MSVLEELPARPAEQRLLESPLADWTAALPDQLRRSLGWTFLLSDRLEEILELARAVPFFNYPAVGFLDRAIDLGLEAAGGLPLFGVILYAETGPEAPPGSLVSVLEFPEIAFAVVVRNGSFGSQAQRPVPAINNGRLACWATSRGGSRQGWLTARHVADDPAFTGRVVDRGPGCIDAALVDVGQTGGGASAIPAYAATAGLPVELDLGVPATGTVLDVITNFGITKSPQFPLRFSTSVSGVGGDSGSLIVETQTASNDPLGIYLGKFTLANPPAGYAATGGVGLAITQLATIMQLEVYP